MSPSELEASCPRLQVKVATLDFKKGLLYRRSDENPANLWEFLEKWPLVVCVRASARVNHLLFCGKVCLASPQSRFMTRHGGRRVPVTHLAENDSA